MNSVGNGSGGVSGAAYPPGLQQQTYPYGLSFQSNASVAIIIVVLGATFFFMFLFLVYIKRCSGGAVDQAGGGGGGGGAWGRQAAVHGLDPDILHKFPIMSYGSVKRTRRRDSVECAVCLGQFEENEKLRLLPTCGHSFHPECIDLWLETHSTCPLCRRSLDNPPPPSPRPPPPSPRPPPPSPSPPPESPPSDIESGGRQVIIRTLSRNSEAFKNAAHDAELREVREKILMRSASGRSIGGSPSSSSPKAGGGGGGGVRCLPMTPRPPRPPPPPMSSSCSSSSRGQPMVPLASPRIMHHSQSCSDLQMTQCDAQCGSRSDRWVTSP